MPLHEIILTVSSNAPSPFQHNKQTLVSLHLLDTKDCTGKTRLDKKQNSSEDKLSKKPKCYDTEAASSGILSVTGPTKRSSGRGNYLTILPAASHIQSFHTQVFQRHNHAFHRQICVDRADSRVSVPCLALLEPDRLRDTAESDRLRDTAPCLFLFLSFLLSSFPGPFRRISAAYQQ